MSTVGLLSDHEIRATGASIAQAQEPDGAIPWFPGGHTDPWDHVESAMGLDVAGFHAQAEAAYDWLRRTQRPDGSWPAKVEQGRVTDARAEAHFCAYVAVGVWHHHRCTGDERFLARMWPTVRAAIDFVVGMQRPGGEIPWARDPDGSVSEFALLTACSSIYQSLRAATVVADTLARPQPSWELAAGGLGHALHEHPERFAPRTRWSMDWYYPVLAGAVPAADARARVDADWDRFVVPGLGIRCVDDRPWVTGAESCELVAALEALGEYDRALTVFEDVQHLRADDGSYWTGYVYEDRAIWPEERSTWTAAAVLLAVDALDGSSPTSDTFHPDALPAGAALDDVTCGPGDRCVAVSGAAGRAASR